MKRTIFRSDRPEPYVTLEYYRPCHQYTLTRDYDGMTFVSSYHDGLLLKFKKISRYGTVLIDEEYAETDDKQAYYLTLKNYDYQKKKLVTVEEGLVSKEVLRMKSHEENELDLRGYLQDMWGSYSVNSYWGAERYCRQFEEME